MYSRRVPRSDTSAIVSPGLTLHISSSRLYSIASLAGLTSGGRATACIMFDTNTDCELILLNEYHDHGASQEAAGPHRDPRCRTPAVPAPELSCDDARPD